MNEKDWRSLLRLMGDGSVVPVVGSRLLLDSDGSEDLGVAIVCHVRQHDQDPARECGVGIFARDHRQPWLLATIMAEFQHRHTFVKALTQLCLSRQTLSAIFVQALRRAATLSNLSGLDSLANRAYSGIFNLCYYQGMADDDQ